MWLVPAIEKLSRIQKFLLGERIQTTALDVLECLIEATTDLWDVAQRRTGLGISGENERDRCRRFNVLD
jgi:hypothetical protein